MQCKNYDHFTKTVAAIQIYSENSCPYSKDRVSLVSYNIPLEIFTEVFLKKMQASSLAEQKTFFTDALKECSSSGKLLLEQLSMAASVVMMYLHLYDANECSKIFPIHSQQTWKLSILLDTQIRISTTPQNSALIRNLTIIYLHLNQSAYGLAYNSQFSNT